MKKLLTILITISVFLLCFHAAYSQSYTYPNGDVLISGEQSPAKMKTQTWQSIHGYIYLPRGYDSSQSKRYALLCFYHGTGGNGDAENAITDQGLGHLIEEGTIPYSSTSPGDTTWFIVFTVAGDFMGSTQSVADIGLNYRFLIDYYKLKIDTNRVYATGLSAGGAQTLIALGEYPDIFVAGVPMSTMWTDVLSKTTLDSTKGWIWQMHGSNDHGGSTNIDNAISNINTYNEENPTHQALLSTYEGGHCCWETFYNPTWVWDTHRSDEIGGPTDMSMYTWLLQYSRTGNSTGEENLSPEVDAGEDQVITLPASSVELTGVVSDDHAVSSHEWTVVSKPDTADITITDPTSLTTTVTGLVAGDYVFRLTATDDSGANNYDEVAVTVNDISDNIPPVANAGADQSHGAGYTNFTLDGSGSSDPDGSIVTYKWEEVSGGGSLSVSDPNAVTTVVNGASDGGTYVFRLIVTDNDGASDSDEVTVTFASIPPSVDAGDNQALEEGTTSTTLTGIVTGGSFDITSYLWEQTSGDDVTITTPDAISTDVTGLTDGNSYSFKLTITDEKGVTATDNVTITVKESEEPPVIGILQFKWIRKFGDSYYLIFQDNETKKYYSIKLK